MNNWEICRFYLDGEKEVIDKARTCICCGCDLFLNDYFYVCEECGAVHDAVFYDAGELCKRANMYKKANYFRLFLGKITGNTYMKKYHYNIIAPLFTNRKTKSISLKEIREKLKEHSLVQKYYRYVPEIYYHLNALPPKVIKQADLIDCYEKYKRLVNYERDTKERLPNSKRFFIHWYLSPRYPFLNTFVDGVYPKVYYKTVKKLFTLKLH